MISNANARNLGWLFVGVFVFWIGIQIALWYDRDIRVGGIMAFLCCVCIVWGISAFVCLTEGRPLQLMLCSWFCLGLAWCAFMRASTWFFLQHESLVILLIAGAAPFLWHAMHDLTGRSQLQPCHCRVD